MNALFGRNVRVTIGDRRYHNSLRVAFDIEKTLGMHSVSGRGRLALWNLAPQGRAVLAAADAPVTIEAGYGEDLPLLYSGQVMQDVVTHRTRVTTMRDAVDWKTTIELTSGLAQIARSQSGLSFPPRSSLREVLTSLTQATGISLDSSVAKVISEVQDQELPRGIAFSGRAFDALIRLCETTKICWWIDNNTLKFSPQDAASYETTVVLSPRSGLLGSPERGLAGRLKVRALLNTLLSPGRTVELQAKTENGLYRIHKVKHIGDTYGADYYTDAEMAPL